MTLSMVLFFVLNLILSLIPIPAMLLNCWPVWLVLFFYWMSIFYQPRHSFMWIWGLGLLFDLLQGSYLGVHVIALSMLNIMLNAHRHKFVFYPIIQQCMLIFWGTAIYLVFSQLYLQDLSPGRFILYVVEVSLVTAFIWPWLEFYFTRPARLRDPRFQTKVKII